MSYVLLVPSGSVRLALSDSWERPFSGGARGENDLLTPKQESNIEQFRNVFVVVLSSRPIVRGPGINMDGTIFGSSVTFFAVTVAVSDKTGEVHQSR